VVANERGGPGEPGLGVGEDGLVGRPVHGDVIEDLLDERLPLLGGVELGSLPSLSSAQICLAVSTISAWVWTSSARALPRPHRCRRLREREPELPGEQLAAEAERAVGPGQEIVLEEALQVVERGGGVAGRGTSLSFCAGTSANRAGSWVSTSAIRPLFCWIAVSV